VNPTAVTAAAEHPGEVAAVAARGHHHCRCVISAREPLRNVEPVEVGKLHIEQDGSWVQRLRGGQAGLPV